mgnify:CR=1 FL=1|tara:strand:+ start:1050 stop:1223 length:174 start_codon:yes stop_codon:yes gene_type:complete
MYLGQETLVYYRRIYHKPILKLQMETLVKLDGKFHNSRVDLKTNEKYIIKKNSNFSN